MQLAVSPRTGHDTHLRSRLTVHITASFGTGLRAMLSLAPHIGTVVPAMLRTIISVAHELGAVTSGARAFTVHRCAFDIAGAMSTGLFADLGFAVAAFQAAFSSSACAFTL